MSALVFVLVMLLLVVASNVATLVFARTWSRAPELAVRTALGAARSARGRAVVLRNAGARLDCRGDRARSARILGARATSGVRSRAWPFWVTLDPNPRIVAFVVFLTLLVGVVSGLLPALRVTRHDLRQHAASRAAALRPAGSAGSAPSLLVVEIALSVALLNGAVTMARAFEVVSSTMFRRCRRARC